eukprot:SAG31_NODE_36011_length_317_cov_0.944954_1_plen_66_part_01
MGCSESVPRAAGIHQHSKDVPWLIDWEDRTFDAKSFLTVSGAGYAPANGIYYPVQWNGKCVFVKRA